MSAQLGAGDFTMANALSTLLTTESLLFAAFSLAVGALVIQPLIGRNAVDAVLRTFGYTPSNLLYEP